MFKRLVVITFMATITILFTSSSYAVDVDLLNETIHGQPISSKLSFYMEKYGQPDKNNNNYMVDYYKSNGFFLYVDTKTGLVSDFSAYFSDYDPSNPEKVPSGTTAFKGNASFGIRKGATFNNVFDKLRAEFTGRACAMIGPGMVYYGGAPKNYKMKVIILQLKQGAAIISFDENDIVAYLNVVLDRDYWDRIGGSHNLGNFLSWHN